MTRPPMIYGHASKDNPKVHPPTWKDAPFLVPLAIFFIAVNVCRWIRGDR